MILIYVFYSQVKLRLRAPVRSKFWKDAIHGLRQRDYLLRELRVESESELRLKEILLDELRAGRMRSIDLEALDSFQSVSDRQRAESLGLLGSYVAHLGFVLLVPSLFRILVLAKLFLDRSDLFEFLLGFMTALLSIILLIRRWPEPPLGRDGGFENFVCAYLGVEGSSLEAEVLSKLRHQALMEGQDETQARTNHLRDWHLGETARFKARLSWFENALGPLELLASCAFAVLLLGVPLLSHFSGLLVP